MVEAIRQGDIPGVQLRVRQPIRSTIDETWRWLAERDLWQGWICDRFEAGDEIRKVQWTIDEPDGATAIEIVTITRSEPPLLLEAALRHPEWDTATHLVFEVGRGAAGDSESSELSIFHRHFERLPLSQGLTIWERYRRRWRTAAERLAAAIAEKGGQVT